jgi:hypothetical protein
MAEALVPAVVIDHITGKKPAVEIFFHARGFR